MNANKGTMNKQETTQETSLEGSLKSQDTEEWLDIHFYRPIGYFWARCAMKVGITPNIITITSMFIGVFAVLCFYPVDLKINILGMVCLVLANSFDSADGQLARLTNNHTLLGRILDGLAGDLWFIGLYLIICLRLDILQGFSGWIWLLGSLAGISHICHAAMADYYRNIHLLFVKGENGSEHDTYESMNTKWHALKFPKDWFQIIWLWFYRNYTHQQEMMSPKFQHFFKTLTTMYSNSIPNDLSNEIREKNKKYMPLTNILQFNTRVLFCFFCLFINQVWLYFVFDLVVMNSVLIYLILKEEKLFASYDKELQHIKNIKA